MMKTTKKYASVWTQKWQFLYLMGTRRIICSYFLSRHDKFMVCVRISSRVAAKIEVTFFVFKNQDRIYPIFDVSDDIEESNFGHRRKDEWIESCFLSILQLLKWSPLCLETELAIYLENCVEYGPKSALETALTAINFRLEHFPRIALIWFNDWIKSCCAHWTHYSKRWDNERAEKGLKFASTSTESLLNPGMHS